MLAFIFIFLLSSILILPFFNKQNTQLIKKFATIVSGVILIFSSTFLLKFDKTVYSLKFVEPHTIDNAFFELSFSFGLDGVSVLLFVSTALLTFVCILLVLDQKPLKYYVLILLIIEFLLFLSLFKF